MKTQFYLIFGFLMILFIGCKNETSNEESVKIENLGAVISYDDSKVGDTTLFFVHGWAIDKGYWEKQVKYFKQNYRVVTIDLPGFGGSGKVRDVWSVENYAADISAVIHKLKLKNVILVGHSMSGVIVLEAALKNPKTVIGIVGVDNFKSYGIPVIPEEKAQSEGIYKQLRSNYTSTITQYTQQYLLSPQTDSIIGKRILNDVIKTDSVIAVNVLEANDQFPADDRLNEYGKTLYLINSSFFPNDTSAFKKNNIPYKLFDIGKTGHYPMLEKPDEFNKYLRMILRDV